MADASTFITTLSRTTSLRFFFFSLFSYFCRFLEPANAQFSTSHPPAGPPISSISAAPSFLPGAPEPSVQPPAAALSPDALPVFPSPRLGGNTPATIPASRSPPNPDKMVPDVASSLPPLGSSAAAAAAAAARNSSAADASDGRDSPGTAVMFGLAFLWIHLLAGNCRWWFR